MSTHKHFDKICCVVLAVTLLLAGLFMAGEHLGIQKADTVMEYESKLFDTSKVHSIDIVMDDWDEFIDNCQSEEYYDCTVVIDGQTYKDVAIRGKGNTSLTQVASYGNNRYSFKIEFDHYDSSNTYYGLDKLCLNNIIQDNTYMKDYLTYQMMSKMGVASPLCSYVYITVNGEDWGLYLAVEGVEESFLQRNYGSNYGELYKPDSMNMGGGRGNGKDFDMDNFFDEDKEETETADTTNDSRGADPGQSSEHLPPSASEGQKGGGMGRDMTSSSDDVLLKYVDDNEESYSNIFDNAKTDISDADKTRLINALKNLSTGENLSDTVDIEAVIRYFVVHNFVLNFDSYTGSMIHNYYLYEEDGQMQMIPWDYNLAFGGFQSAGNAASLINYPIDSPVSGGDVEDRPMLAWIFASEEYTELYHEYFSEFIEEYFDSGYFEEMINSTTELISPYVEKDPTKFCTYKEFETGVSTLKEFCLLRAESITRQLQGTIGSTSETQDSETLIGAGDLQISDMGTMNASMAGGGNDSGVDKGAAADSDSMPQKPQDDSNNQHDFAQREDPPPGAPGDSQSEAFGVAPSEAPSGGPVDSQSEVSGDAPPAIPEDSAENNAQDFGNRGPMADGNTTDVNGEQGGSEQGTSSAEAWIWTGISALILALGLCFAWLYKRRR